MTSFFGVGGNPFSTPVGQKIEQATDGSLASENWALNMEICDLINETEEGPKDAIKAIRKRLQQSVGKNYTIVMFTLTVLETCVKNCGKRFHILVCNKEFISELVKLIGPKNGPPTAVQEKVLSLIQSWVDAFHQHQDLNGVVQVYQELKIKGIEFPMTDLDSMAPIHTPKKSVKSEPERIKTPPNSEQSAVGEGESIVQGGSCVGVALTPEQLTKLKADLDIVQANMTVFGEMLNELSTPGPQPPADMELFQGLHSTLVAMQERLVELISKLSSDEITAELLRINDHLNNLFLRYTRFEKNRNAKEGPIAGAGEASLPTDSLIDLGDEATGPIPSVTKQLENLAVGHSNSSTLRSPVKIPHQVRPDAADSDFDMFAQSRNVTYESSKAGGSTYESNSKPDQVSGNLGAAAEARAQGTPHPSATAMHKESDFDEMAAWLGEGGGAGGGEESLTSSEFERFLAERAAAAEALPSAGNSSTVSSPRRSAKQAEAESSLFAL
ncbi:hypothetical protein O3M35_011393 [Rhynocoris fuscipes]|uniref:TOM1-like protein 2 n=1 Tax=Rhynocoris fuscipes TaxID=488301 RepID=A0AAW1CVL3_9HEMI